MNQAIYDCIAGAAREQRVVHYGEIAPLAHLDMADPHHRKVLGDMLDEISRAEDASGHPLLSAVVVQKESSMPGNGFFVLARELGRWNGSDEQGFFVKELKRVYDYWRKS